MFSIIAAIGKNRELGKNGQLIFHIKEDLQFFKSTTTGHTIVMGRKTWDSIGRPLPGRKNLVVSHSEVKDADGTITDLPAFIASHKDTEEEIFIIGGGTLYKAFLPYAKTLYLTEIDATAEDADTFFPDFNPDNYTKTIIRKGSENDLDFSFVKYTLK